MWQELGLLGLTGMVTFGGVFLGVILASKRERYARHVDRLKADAVAILERWANEVENGFSVHEIAFRTLDEKNPKELEGFERRHYWDVPDIFYRPWDTKDKYVVSLAAEHWPGLANWSRITELGELTYKNTGLIHKALVHVWDGADLPRQLESHGHRELASFVRFPEMNLAVASPGMMARATMDSALYWLARKKPDELIAVEENEGAFGVYGFGRLLAVLPDKESAERARTHAVTQLTKWKADEAAKRISEAGKTIEEAVAKLHGQTLEELYRAQARGYCNACRDVAPIRQRAIGRRERAEAVHAF